MPRPLTVWVRTPATVYLCKAGHRHNTLNKATRCERTAERNDEIVRLTVEEHLTYAEIGARFGITREYVRQILNSRGVGHQQAARVEQRRDQAKAFTHEIAGGKLAGRDVGEIAASLGLKKNHVRGVWAEEKFYYDTEYRLAKPGAPPRTSDEELAEMLREAAELCGEPLRFADYNKLAAQRGWPSHQTHLLRHGTWSQACAHAEVFNRGEGPRRDRVPAEKCLADVRTVAAQLGRIPGAQTYERIARGRRDLTCAATVRKRLGGWKNVIRALSVRTDVTP